MSAPTPNPWLHIGECPFCVNGLCRVRVCKADQNSHHLFAVCDECEASWTEPDTNSKRVFLDPEKPVCPICQSDLHDNSNWAIADDLLKTDWNERTIFEVTNPMPTDSDSDDTLPPAS